MAITITNLTTGGDTTDGTSFTTASITPAANSLILVAITSTSAVDTTPNTPTGNSLTYVSVVQKIQGLTRLSFFRSIGASPSAGAITFGFSDTQTDVRWSVLQCTGVSTFGLNGIDAVVQSAANSAATGTSLTVTLGTFEAGATANATVGAFAHIISEGTTPGGGFTELGDSSGGLLALETEWLNCQDTTVDASWSTTSVNIGIAVEVRALGTRFYLPSDTLATGISPTASASWEDTSILTRTTAAANTPRASAMTTVSFTDNNAANRDVAFKQFVIGTLTAGQTITGSQALRFQARCKQRADTNNMFLSFGIRVIASDGTTVNKTVLDVFRDTVNECESAALTNRRITTTSAATNYATVSGDYLVFEVGTSGDPDVGNDHDSDIRLGDAAAARGGELYLANSLGFCHGEDHRLNMGKFFF